MITTAPRLQTRRPSPTTAEFTVTTLPPTTLTLRILRTLLMTIRIALALTLALALHARWIQSPFSDPAPPLLTVLHHRDDTNDLPPQPPLEPPETLLSEYTIWYTLALLHSSPLGRSLSHLVERIPLPTLIPASLALAYALSLRVHSSESLLVMRGLGVQTSESPSTYLASTATRFIPTERIQDVLVNEAFRGFEVRYYLVVVVEGEEDVVVVFPGLLPRRRIVEEVWRGARDCLYERQQPGKESVLVEEEKKKKRSVG